MRPSAPALPAGLLALALASPTLAAGLSAQQDDHRISVTATFEPAKAGPGEQVTLRLHVDIEDGWHIYGRGGDPALSPPPTLKLGKTVLKPRGELQVPEGVEHETGPWLEGEAVLRQVFEVPAGTAAGSLKLAGRVAYMACTPTLCNPPMELDFEAELEVQGAAKTRAVHQGDHVRIEAVLVPARARPGERVTLELRGKIDQGYHVYGANQDPKMGKVLTITLPGDSRVRTVGKLELPPGEEREWFGNTYHFVEGSFTARQKLRVPKDAGPGRLAVPFHLEYEVCDDQYCVGGRDDLVVELAVEEGEPVETGAPADDDTTLENPLLGKSLIEIILLAIGAGLFALVMPCTYPMIPITVSYFTKQAESRDGSVLPLALTYGAGIVAIFVLVGVLVGEPIIRFAQNGWVNLALCLVFIYFALALFGVYELRPPRFLMDATSGASTKGGYVGVFLMGVALVVATFACTFPVLGMLLALTATHEGAHYGLVALGMGVFGLTMAVPFVVLSLVPGKLQAMPRSGEWMNTAKVFFAFIELAMALKFFSNADMVWDWKILPRELFLFVWSVIFLLTALYLVGQSLKHGLRNTAVGRLVLGIVTLLMATYFLYGAMGHRLHSFMANFEPGYSRTDIPQHTVVYEDYDKAIAVAKASNKKVLVNFTGVT